MTKFAIVGGGNAGATYAAHLKLLGAEWVSLYDVIEPALKPIIENNNTLTLGGRISVKGEAKLDLVTMDVREAIGVKTEAGGATGVDVIICTAPAHVHKFVAKDLAKCIQPHQVLMLNPGRTGGVLEVKKVLKEEGCQHDILVVESQSILYACRRTGTNINVFGYKKELPCAGLPVDQVSRFFELMKPWLPEFVSAGTDGIWKTSMDNIGMLFHPTPTLMNLSRMEIGVVFDYYIDGFTPSVCEVVEKIDKERLAVAEALGVTIPSAVQWLEKEYGAKGKDLFEAIHANEQYVGITAPLFKDVNGKRPLRYVMEDVPGGLVPVSELGKVFDVPTPCVDSIINFAGTVWSQDFWKTGRNLKQLGLEGFGPDEIRSIGRG